MFQTLPHPQPHHLTLGFEKERFHRHTGLPVPVQGQPLAGRTAIKEYPLRRKPSSQQQRHGLSWGPHQETHTRMGTISTFRVGGVAPQLAGLGSLSRLGCAESVPTLVHSSSGGKMLIPTHSRGTSLWISYTLQPLKKPHQRAAQYTPNPDQAKETASFPLHPKPLSPWVPSTDFTS